MALMRIRYKGLSDARVISAKDAEAHGVSLSHDLIWDNVGKARGGLLSRPNTNDGVVVDGLSDELLKVLKDEGTFTITEITKDGLEGQTVITGEALDDTGSTVVDKTSGQKSTKK
jgi:hypothetical protein